MSKFRTRYGQAVSRRGIVELAPHEFRESYPALSEALSGAPAGDGMDAMFPHTVMIFLEGGRLKWCLNASQANAVGFGTVEDPSKPLESIDRAIAEDRIDWRVRKQR